MNLAGSQSGAPHALSLHVVRLARPTFDFEPPLRLAPEDLRPENAAEEDDALFDKASSIADAQPSTSSSSTFAAQRSRRALRSDPLDALEGERGLLSLRPQFGAVYLGEPFYAALSLVAAEASTLGAATEGGGTDVSPRSQQSPSAASASSSPSVFAEALAGGGAADVSLRVELTADGERSAATTATGTTPAVVLADTGESPVALLAPGQRYDALLRHDVRCVGRHTLVAAASYTVPATGERRHLSQYFSFSAAAPLGVRTKVRPFPTEASVFSIGKENSIPAALPAVLVEATIDNARRGQCLSLEPPKFDASAGLEATPVGAEGEGDSTIPPPPIPPNGAASFVWIVRPKDAAEGAAGPAPSSSSPAASAAAALAAAAASTSGLGRLDLRWRTPFGGLGRLQTQGIAPPPSASRRVSLSLAGFEGDGEGQGGGVEGGGSVDARSRSPSSSCCSCSAPLEKPFEVTLSVTSRVESAVGPLVLLEASSNATAGALCPPSPTSSSSVVLLGPPSRAIARTPLQPMSRTVVSVKMLALAPGVQRLPALRLVDSSDGATLDILSGWVMVSPPSSRTNER